MDVCWVGGVSGCCKRKPKEKGENLIFAQAQRELLGGISGSAGRYSLADV